MLRQLVKLVELVSLVCDMTILLLQSDEYKQNETRASITEISLTRFFRFAM